MNLELAKLRWFTRTLISLTELGIFVFIIWLIFLSDSAPNSEFLNILSVIIGAVALNLGKSSSWFFQNSTETEPVDQKKNIETKRPLQPEGVDQKSDGNPAGHQQ